MHQVADKLGVKEAYITKRCSGGGAKSDASAATRHARFAAACALNALLSEAAPVAVELKYGRPNTLTAKGQQLCIKCTLQQAEFSNV